jgi:hypothetical protein
MCMYFLNLVNSIADFTKSFIFDEHFNEQSVRAAQDEWELETRDYALDHRSFGIKHHHFLRNDYYTFSKIGCKMDRPPLYQDDRPLIAVG